MIAIYVIIGFFVSLIALGAWKAGELVAKAWCWLSRRREARRLRCAQRLPLMLHLHPIDAVRQHQLRRLVRLR